MTAWMNEYEVTDARARYADHPVLGPATATLQALVEWTNANSDGWPYWSKPSRAAAKLQDLIQGDGTSATPAAYAAALRPLRSFRTRQGATFTITTRAV